MKGIVVYSEKNKDAAGYAALLGKQFNLPLLKSSTSSLRKVTASDFVLVLSPLIRKRLSIRPWLARVAELLPGKKFLVFVITGTHLHNAENTNLIVSENIPAGIRKNCDVIYLPAKAEDKEIALNHDLITKIAVDMYSGVGTENPE